MTQIHQEGLELHIYSVCCVQQSAITLGTEYYLPVELVAQNKSLKKEFGAVNCNCKIVQIKNSSYVV